jgi:prevent-host-death family protein
MKFVSARELRINPAPVLARVQEGDHEVVVTSHGKPVALMVSVTSDDFEDTLEALRRARAQVAVSRLRAHAQRQGLDALDTKDVDEEIRAIRSARQQA